MTLQDKAAKEAAGKEADAFTLTPCPLISIDVLKDKQKAASQNEKSSWLKDGAIFTRRYHDMT